MVAISQLMINFEWEKCRRAASLIAPQIPVIELK